MMECDKIQSCLFDYIDNNLSEKDAEKIARHIEICKACESVLKETEELLSSIVKDEMIQPSKNLGKNFEQMLIEEKKNLETKVVKLQAKTNWKSYLQVAASIVLIVSAFFIGKNQAVPYSTITSIETQQTEHELLLLTSIVDQSASKRIQAVTDSEKFENTDIKIIQALINRLFFDKNTNVRIAAAEALSKFSSLEMVKSALIKSLETEQSPIIQIELIQILAKIQEKRALEPMKKLLENKDVPNYVKQELRYNISSLL